MYILYRTRDTKKEGGRGVGGDSLPGPVIYIM